MSNSNKKKIFLIFIICFVCLFVFSSDKSRDKLKKKDLPQKYQKWLDLVEYIITPTEREIFLKLRNNRDRDSFIEMFWKQRDPTKGTPENEFKEEHIRRFNYANKYFKYGTPKEGWRTDRGRIYIILGPPLDRNIVDTKGIYPMEIWEYYGKKREGLPNAFRVVFFKKHGIGEYKLYSPLSDGPASLFVRHIGEIDEANYFEVYKKLEKRNPIVAEAAITLIPGEIPADYRPSLRSPLVIADIMNYPKRQIKTTYATNFLEYKGIVEVDSTVNYIESKNMVEILKNPILDLNFVHIGIQPEKISVDYSDSRDKYYLNYTLNVSLKKEGSLIFQYSKNFPLYLSEEQMKNQLPRGLIITDCFPVIKGSYELNVLIQNSVNKEFSYFKKNIDTTNAYSSIPHIYGPVLSYQIEDIDRIFFSSFKIADKKISILPEGSFGLSDDINLFFCVDKANYEDEINCKVELKTKESYEEFSSEYKFNLSPDKNFQCFSKKLEKLSPAGYKLKIIVSGKNNIALDVKEKDFIVSPLAHVAHPLMVSKNLQDNKNFIFYNILARQYRNVGDEQKAEKYYEKAYNINSTFPELLKDYASFLVSKQQYERVFEIIEPLKTKEKYLFDYYAFKGKAYYYKGDFNKAIDNLLKANNIYDSDVSVLNFLGYSFLRAGDKQEAIKAFSASLKLNKNQKKVTAILENLKNKKTNKEEK